MNIYGVATGTDTYSIDVSASPGSKLQRGDIVTASFLNANTGAATLEVNGGGRFPITLNGAALSASALSTGVDYQFTFTGSAFAKDPGGAGGGSTTLEGLTDWPLTTNGDLLVQTAGAPARQAMGSALQVLRVNAGATALEYADPSASDATKLPLAGGAMTGPVQFSGSMTPAGASVAQMYSSASGLHINFPNDTFLQFLENAGAFLRLSGDYGILMDGFSQTFNTSLRNIFADTGGNLKVNSSSSTAAVLCSAGGGTTFPEVAVHGLSETAYAGAIEVKAGGVTLVDDGTWRHLYSLAKGTHAGVLQISAKGTGVNSAIVYYQINGTAISYWTMGNDSTITWVNSGSEASGNIALRISGGAVEYNCGTGLPSDVKVGVIFLGEVIS